MPLERPSRRLAPVLCAASLAASLLALGACAGAPPGPGAGGLAPGRPAGTGEAATAALNARLLAQAAPSAAEDDLAIGPGDLIEVTVFEVKELSDLKVRVPLRGSVTLPLLGSVPAAGRTAAALEGDLRQRLQQRYMHDPQVSVFVVEQKSQRITVVGAVRRGGVYPVTSRMRLADALALAEGLADDADHVVHLVRRLPAGTVALAQSGARAPAPSPTAAEPHSAAPPAAPPGGPTEEVMAAVDLDALAAGRDDLNVALQAGDVVNVPRAGSYYVGGEVERPGSFFLKAKTTVEQAITTAGGVKGAADWDDVRIYRTRPDGGREILTASLNAIQGGAAAPELAKNDVVVVGKSGVKAFFYGFADFFKGIFGVSKGL